MPGTFADDESVPGRLPGTLGALDRRLRVVQCPHVAEPATAMGVIVASAPPASITSLPPRAQPEDSPMACAPAAHAETAYSIGAAHKDRT